MDSFVKSHCRGISTIEIIIAVAVLVILVSFASPSISGATTRTEMRAAAENVEYSIRIARNTARMTESEVWMNVLSDEETGRGRITFTLSDKARKSLGQPALQTFDLDPAFSILADQSSFGFNHQGIVVNPGEITLVSKDDETLLTNFTLK